MSASGKFSMRRVRNECRKARSEANASAKSGSVKKTMAVLDRRRNGPVKHEK